MGQQLLALVKREFGGYFASPIAFVFLAAFLTSAHAFFMQNFFLSNQTTMRSWFEMLPWFLLLLVPALTMRLWAEEKKSSTEEVLLTLPISDALAVGGKFLGCLAFYLVCLIFSLPLALVVSSLGNLDWGQVLGQYLGAILLGGGMISVGLLISSLTDNQIISFIGTLMACFLLLTINSPLITGVLPQAFVPVLQQLSLTQHYQNMIKGLLDLRDVVYFASLIIIFLYGNIKSLESRYWQ